MNEERIGRKADWKINQEKTSSKIRNREEKSSFKTKGRKESMMYR